MENNGDFDKKIVEHFVNPENFGRIERPNGIGCVEDIVSGDRLTMFIRVENDVIADISFLIETISEALATIPFMASSSAATELAKGRTIQEALKITNEHIIAHLGGIREKDASYPLLAEEALVRAIDSYRQNKEGLNGTAQDITAPVFIDIACGDECKCERQR